MLVAQGAHAPSLHDHGRLGQRPSNPPHGKRSQNVPVAHDQDVARDARHLRLPDHLRVILIPDLGDQAVQSVDDVLRRFPAGAAVAPDVPVRVKPLLGA